MNSSVVPDVLTRNPVFIERSMDFLVRWGTICELSIDAVVWSEVSIGFSTIGSLEATLAGAGFLLRPIPREALVLAGKYFIAYRRRGGSRMNPLPDFFIGAPRRWNGCRCCPVIHDGYVPISPPLRSSNPDAGNEVTTHPGDPGLRLSSERRAPQNPRVRYTKEKKAPAGMRPDRGNDTASCKAPMRG